MRRYIEAYISIGDMSIDTKLLNKTSAPSPNNRGEFFFICLPVWLQVGTENSLRVQFQHYIPQGKKQSHFSIIIFNLLFCSKRQATLTVVRTRVACLSCHSVRSCRTFETVGISDISESSAQPDRCQLIRKYMTNTTFLCTNYKLQSK